MPTKEKQSNNSIPKILLGGNLLGYSIQENDVRKLFYDFEKFNINGIDTADVYGNGLSETLIERISPISIEIKRLLSDKNFLDDILQDGSERANEIAVKKMKKIHEIVGF